MIHILTVHWRTDRWVGIQLEYLARYVQEPYRLYSFLTGVPAIQQERFFYASTEPIESHPVKLNRLAAVAEVNAESDDDWLIFLDGDAFPIADLVHYGRDKLSRYALAAVQRKENNGDIQPHPCFCLTTIGFWKSIRGDWLPGYHWRNNQNELVTDVGGNLLRQLLDHDVAWYPMLRSNKTNLHPVFFGIYDDVVYHHGSGFRSGMSRQLIMEKKRAIIESTGWLKALRDVQLFRPVYGLLDPLIENRAKRIARADSVQISSEVFQRILDDHRFYAMFQ